MAKTGWFNESKRHDLARQGIKTAQNKEYKMAMSMPKKDMKNPYLPDFVNNSVLTEQEVNLLKRRLNDGKIKPSEIPRFKEGEGYQLTSDQNEKGKKYLINQWKGKSGAERKNNPFGAREEDILENFDRIELVDFYNASNYYQSQAGIKNYIPLYDVVAKDGSRFQYYVGYTDRNQASPVNIVG